MFSMRGLGQPRLVNVSTEINTLGKIVTRIRFFYILPKGKIQAIVPFHSNSSAVETLAHDHHLRSARKLLDVSGSKFFAFESLNFKCRDVLQEGYSPLQKHKVRSEPGACLINSSSLRRETSLRHSQLASALPSVLIQFFDKRSQLLTRTSPATFDGR